MIQSNRDLYQNLNEIIRILNLSGEQEQAKQLEDALSISTVPSEVLGETRLVLINLKNTKLIEKLNLKIKIEKILQYLNSVL